ncbi:MAG: hypothetical protein HKN19_17975 [Halioglobus sp.]|nr:hypothetical protein [Halioglobus sp.]
MSKVNRLSDNAQRQLDAFMTPGSLLKTARLRSGLSEGEVAERLKILPEYVAVLERDEHTALRSPAFARGYVKSYGRLLGLDLAQLERAFDGLAEPQDGSRMRMRARPLQLQRTGRGVVVGLGALFALVFMLWWLRGDLAAPAWPDPADRSVLELPPAAVPAPVNAS